MYEHTEEKSALFQKAISQELKAELAICEIPNDTIANQLHVHRSTLYKYVGGKSTPTVDFMYSFCKLVGIKPEWFMRRVLERLEILKYNESAATGRGR